MKPLIFNVLIIFITGNKLKVMVNGFNYGFFYSFPARQNGIF